MFVYILTFLVREGDLPAQRGLTRGSQAQLLELSILHKNKKNWDY